VVITAPPTAATIRASFRARPVGRIDHAATFAPAAQVRARLSGERAVTVPTRAAQQQHHIKGLQRMAARVTRAGGRV
jgi:hypothetical protein